MDDSSDNPSGNLALPSFPARRDQTRRAELALSHAKYGWESVDQHRAAVCAFIPHRAIAWNGLFENATRFTFP